MGGKGKSGNFREKQGENPEKTGNFGLKWGENGKIQDRRDKGSPEPKSWDWEEKRGKILGFGERKVGFGML